MTNTEQSNQICVWVYNVCLFERARYLLLARRRGSEALFWHLAIGKIDRNLISAAPDYFENAHDVIREELGIKEELGVDFGKISYYCAHYDMRGETSRKRGTRCVHVIADFGPVSRLPSADPKVFETKEGPKGVVSAKWVELAKIEFRSSADDMLFAANYDFSEKGASKTVFYDGLPLHNVVASVVRRGIVYEYLKRMRGEDCLNPLSAQGKNPERSLREGLEV